jgi:hypothetical protein
LIYIFFNELINLLLFLLFVSYQNFKLSRGFLRPVSVILYSPYLSTDNHLMSFRNSSMDCTNFLLLSNCFEPRLILRIRLLFNSLKIYLAKPKPLLLLGL